MVSQKQKEMRVFHIVLTMAVVVSFAAVTHAQQQRTSTLSLGADFDQDGLSNKEEALFGTDPDNRDTDGDGYSDGVEVESGYDPLIPADQGDRRGGIAVIDDDVSAFVQKHTDSLTSELTTRVAGVTVDVLNGEEVDLEDVGDELNDLIEERASFEYLPQVDVDSIKIKRQNYGQLDKDERERRLSQDAREYIISISYLFSLHSPRPIGSNQEIEIFSQELIDETTNLEVDYTDLSYFEGLGKSGKKLLRDLKDISVPESLLPLHAEGLQIASNLSAIGTIVATNVDDPVAAAVGYSQMYTVMTMLSVFLDKVDIQVRKYDIKK